MADDLVNYFETDECAEELDEKIAKTDALIDEIVYELYGLTDEESSVEAWQYRLKLFREWTEEAQIESVGEFRGYDFDDDYEHRVSQIAPVTLEGEMWTLRMFVECLEQLNAVDSGLHESVRTPDLDPGERSSDVALDQDPALTLLNYYRNSDAE